MKKIRIIVGIVLIAIGAIGLFYWETTGREAIMTDEILVAAERIPAGTPASPELFAVAGVLKENRVEGALTPEEFSRIQGQPAARDIPAREQVTESQFPEDAFLLKTGQSIFALSPDWISMRSSSLRRGDRVEIYEDGQFRPLGAFRVAFVKDSVEAEVRTLGEAPSGSPLERTDSSSIISHIEIIASMDDYLRIAAAATGEEAARLILVQKEAVR